MEIQYSIIIPVYNRPQEIDELLNSLLFQQYSKSFEIVIGFVKGERGISCKTCRTSSIPKYGKLVNIMGYKEQGTYLDRVITNYRITKYNKWTYFKTSIPIKMNIGENITKYLEDNYDLDIHELEKFIEKYEPERII